MTGGMTSGAATTVGAEASASATGTIGAMIGTTITGATMTRATDATKANTVWAYATAGHYHEVLLADCSRVISDSLARDPSI